MLQKNTTAPNYCELVKVCAKLLRVPRKAEKQGRSTKSRPNGEGQPVSLKQLATTLGLSPTTLSLVLNDAEKAKSIPQETKDRIFAAARALNYRPNFVAKSLRKQRTYTVGVMIPELSDGYSALVLTGIEDFLLKAGYMYLVTSHRHDERLIHEYPRRLYDRAVEGLIAVDTAYDQELPLPVVSVSGTGGGAGVSNILLNHDAAAELALRHLTSLGHHNIAFIKGQTFSSDTEVRWDAICRAAKQLDIAVNSKLVSRMQGTLASPEIGYHAARKLLSANVRFTALFAFNDVCAIGAIRAFREAGLQVPDDVSVVGFDDIYEAAYHIPALTTIKQPLVRMGMLAAETVTRRIVSPEHSPAVLRVEPELVVRESTAPARSNMRAHA